VTQLLLLAATTLQVVAVVYCVLLLRKHFVAAAPWLCLLGAMLSMLVWRVVMTTGATPGPVFNTTIAIWGSVCAVLAMFFFGREVARRARAEAERDRLLESERAARSEAERANRIKDDFLATLSHELRTPLAAILGWCTILGMTPAGSSDATRALETIERNARMQTRLVDDLLDATRMHAGALHLERATVSLDAPVAAAVEGVGPAAEAKGVSLHFSCDPPPPVVTGDPSRLQQVASNLLVNAVKFTPGGKSVRVTLTAADGHAVLTVADDGIGIEPAFMPQLFQRFRQADSSSTRRHGGLGIGLSIVSSLVQLHGGEVRASSDGPGTGATFTVRLPLALAVAPTVSFDRAALASAVAPSKSLNGVRIIVVDDEADVRGALTRLLEQSGAVVLALESGATIESSLTAFEPDVLLLDISMPVEDGYTLIRRIRRRAAAEGGKVPAISLTAHAREEDRQHAIASGFQAHLAKPVQLSLLVATIWRLVGPHLATSTESNVAASSDA
jgi:signal transduction histidine kinase/ActR/RegA family two-component response regulator